MKWPFVRRRELELLHSKLDSLEKEISEYQVSSKQQKDKIARLEKLKENLELRIKELSYPFKKDPSFLTPFRLDNVMIPTIPASYVISKKGIYYFAQPCRHDLERFYGRDATSVIQLALNSLTSGRTWQEKILCKGSFVAHSKINIPAYTIFEVQGKFKLGDNVNEPLLETETGGKQISLIGGEYDGNKANNSWGFFAGARGVIHFYAGENSCIKHIFLHDSPGLGIRVAESGKKTIILNKIKDVTAEGHIRLTPTASDVDVWFNRISGSGATPIYFDSADRCSAGLNRIDFSSGEAIWLKTATYNTVIGNKIFGSGAAGWGVREDSASDYNVIKFNEISGVPTPITLVGANTICKDNFGFLTENSGTASGASPITIPQTTHLLDVDPRYVNAVSKTSGYYVISVGYDSVSKDITIEHSGGATSIDVFWEAKA